MVHTFEIVLYALLNSSSCKEAVQTAVSFGGDTDTYAAITGAAAGVATNFAEVAAVVEKHRELLSAFFPVSAVKHYLISRAYINDERFKSHYESRQAGLASWLADAIENVTERNGVDLQDPEQT